MFGKPERAESPRMAKLGCDTLKLLRQHWKHARKCKVSWNEQIKSSVRSS